MVSRINRWINETAADEWALIVVVVIGYFVGLIGVLDRVTAPEILVTFVLATVYLLLGRGADHFFVTYPSGWIKAAYFALQMALALGIVLILGPGVWLITLPLAGTAAGYLKKWWQQGLVYLAILGLLAVPFIVAGEWQEALYLTLSLVPAIVFVVVFVRLANSAQEAREAAERLAEELEEANHQLAAYSTQIEELARSQERNRLAREIHDNLGHYLTVVNVQIRAAQAVMESDPQKARDALQKAQRLNQEGLAAVRQSVAALRESPVSSRSLVEALQQLVKETENSGIQTWFEVQGQEQTLDPNTALTVYRTAQEGLTNVRKHAQASEVRVLLRYEEDLVQLTIADNGRGTIGERSKGFGLLGIRERVDLLGGVVGIESQPGEGFQLMVSLPMAGTRQTAAVG